MIALLDLDPIDARELQPLVEQFSSMVGIPVSISYEERRLGWLNIDAPLPRFHVTRDGTVTTMTQVEFQDWVKSVF